MADIKHSPGPWYWNGNSLISGKHGYYLMHTEECPGLGHSAEANKKLIAAAPDLLAMLKVAQLWLEVDGRFDMQGINAAIAKAEAA